MLPTLKMEEQPPAKEPRWPVDIWKGKEMDSDLEPPERNVALLTPVF